MSDAEYIAYLEELERRGDTAALQAELAKVQLTKDQLDRLVSESDVSDWNEDDGPSPLSPPAQQPK